MSQRDEQTISSKNGLAEAFKSVKRKRSSSKETIGGGEGQGKRQGQTVKGCKNAVPNDDRYEETVAREK